MPPYKDPSFQDRAALSAQAKQKALEKLKNKPPVDEAVLAARRETAARREAAAQEKRAAKAAQAEAEASARAEAAAKVAAAPAPKTEAELKAARDAKYAARKSRK